MKTWKQSDKQYKDIQERNDGMANPPKKIHIEKHDSVLRLGEGNK